MMAGDEEISGAVATVACCTSFVCKLENIRLQAVRLVPFTGTKFTQRNKTWKKKKCGIFFFFSFIGMKKEHKLTVTAQVYFEMNMLY